MKVVELYFCFLILIFDIAESEKKNITDPVKLKESSFEDTSLWFLNYVKDKHGCHKTFILIVFFYVLRLKTIEQRNKCHKHLKVAVYPTHLSI